MEQTKGKEGKQAKKEKDKKTQIITRTFVWNTTQKNREIPKTSPEIQIKICGIHPEVPNGYSLNLLKNSRKEEIERVKEGEKSNSKVWIHHGFSEREKVKAHFAETLLLSVSLSLSLSILNSLSLIQMKRETSFFFFLSQSMGELFSPSFFS